MHGLSGGAWSESRSVVIEAGSMAPWAGAGTLWTIPFRCLPRSVPAGGARQAVQEVLPAQEQLPPGERGRGAEAVVELVAREHLELAAAGSDVAQDNGQAAAVGDVD